MDFIDLQIAIPALALLVTVIVQVAGFSKIFGQISTRLDGHDGQHIRHQTRIDEHQKILSRHDRDLAIVKYKQEVEVSDD
ncbi:hypothetical protein [Oceanobacter sp. 3_MG-2023]|uniref:hypothetical protein n=1 Tax=Oceanobacter sp. 3_MG-2023 TaxID=3062622 RepID=UPI00273315B1|nr:hypothetical protein [Oceanobacter sp. 3_MG-2023]MDP2505398.1 hypothetical protein [Oceanobacter sp. 3_MG-2023]